MIFSVADVWILDVFDWKLVAVFYAISGIMIAFPRLSDIWPFSAFSMLKLQGRWRGVAVFVLLSFVAVPHFLMTFLPLNAEKAALDAGQFEVVEATFDGKQPEQKALGHTFSESTLSFAGVEYDVPGSLHGSMKLLPKIRNKLHAGAKYRLSVSDGVILKIETVSDQTSLN